MASEVIASLIGLSSSELKDLLSNAKVTMVDLSERIAYAITGIQPARAYFVKEKTVLANSTDESDMDANFGGRLRYLRINTDQTIYVKFNKNASEITIAATTYHPAEFHLNIHNIVIRAGGSDAAVKMYGEYL